MSQRRRPDRSRPVMIEPCEGRALSTLVFIFSGNSLGPTRPGGVTVEAARILSDAGETPIQLPTPRINTPAAFESLAREIRALSRGQPVGLVGFSSGGVLAVRLAGVAGLNVTAALDYYGPPDLRDYFNYHRGDYFARYVHGISHITPAALNLLSGPVNTTAYVVGAFGLYDPNVVASVSTASFQNDVPRGQVYDYPGPHGASITASLPALQDFLAHV